MIFKTTPEKILKWQAKGNIKKLSNKFLSIKDENLKSLIKKALQNFDNNEVFQNIVEKHLYWKYQSPNEYYFKDEGLKIIDELELTPPTDEIGIKYLMFLLGKKFLLDYEDIKFDLLYYHGRTLKAYNNYKTQLLPAISKISNHQISDSLIDLLKQDILAEIKDSLKSIKQVKFPWSQDYKYPKNCIHCLSESNLELEPFPAPSLGVSFSESTTTIEGSMSVLNFFVCKNCKANTENNGYYMYFYNGELNLHLPAFGAVFVQSNHITNASFLDCVDKPYNKKPFADVQAVDLTKYFNFD